MVGRGAGKCHSLKEICQKGADHRAMGSPAVLQFFMQFADRARSRFLFLFLLPSSFLPSLPPHRFPLHTAFPSSFPNDFTFCFSFLFLHVTRGDFATLRKQEKKMCPEPEGAGSLCVPQVGAVAPPCPTPGTAGPACVSLSVCVSVCVCVTAFFSMQIFFLLIFYAPRACVCVCRVLVALLLIVCPASPPPSLFFFVCFFFSAWVSCFLTVSFLGGGQDFPKI